MSGKFNHDYPIKHGQIAAAELKLAHARSLRRTFRAGKWIGERTLSACWSPYSAATNFLVGSHREASCRTVEKFAIAERDRQHAESVRSPELCDHASCSCRIHRQIEISFS
jgi:hypothetical protein